MKIRCIECLNFNAKEFKCKARKYYTPNNWAIITECSEGDPDLSKIEQLPRLIELFFDLLPEDKKTKLITFANESIFWN